MPLEELGALKRALVRAAGVEVKPRRVRDRARGRRPALCLLLVPLVKRRFDGGVEPAAQVGVLAVGLERADELAGPRVVHPDAARREPEEPARGLRGGVHLPVHSRGVSIGRIAKDGGLLARRESGHRAASQKASPGGAVRRAHRGRVRPFRDVITLYNVGGGNSLGQNSLAASSLGPLPRRVSRDSRVPAEFSALHGELVHRIPGLNRLEGNRLRVDAAGRVRELAVHPRGGRQALEHRHEVFPGVRVPHRPVSNLRLIGRARARAERRRAEPDGRAQAAQPAAGP